MTSITYFQAQFRVRQVYMRVVAALLTCAALTGCVHRVDIQQGNFLDTEDIDRVSVGMTRIQVRSLLGTPMVADPFVNTRWDYVYYLKRGRVTEPQQRHFIVFFDATDKVERVERATGKNPVKTAATTD